MNAHLLRIATRDSLLAIRQAEIVKSALQKQHPDLSVQLLPLKTTGDQLLKHSLSAIGGKGLFIKEIEQALLENRADIAVHSMKDMPVHLTKQLKIAALLPREDPRDVFVCPKYSSLSALPAASVIGTASLRRHGMIKTLRPDLRIKLLRGNILTRLNKLDQGHYDAIILAAAGLHRLNLTSRIQSYFSPEESLPAVGQGIIGIQCREKDRRIKKLLQPLDHPPTRFCLFAERLLNQYLAGSCHSPIGGYAAYYQEVLHLRGCVYSLKNNICLTAEHRFSMKTDQENGPKQVADKLFALGAAEILAEKN